MALRSQVLGVYREILRYARDAKAPQGSISYFEQAKAEFRLHVAEMDQEVIKKLIEKAQSKLGFLKIVAPRRSATMTGGKSNYVFREGEGLVEKSTLRSKNTVFKDDRIDPDDLARHHRLLKYVKFLDFIFFRCFTASAPHYSELFGDSFAYQLILNLNL